MAEGGASALEISGEPVVLRGATAEDHAAYVRLHAELGVPGAPVSAAAFAASMVAGVRLATVAGEVVGLAWAQVRADALHIKHLITDPGHRRRGVGRLLMADAAARARALGLQRWRLNVKPENTAARALYRSLGLVERHASAVLKLRWRDVSALPAPPPSLVAAPLAATVEAPASLGFAPGELASLRAAAGPIWWGLSEGARLVAIASFDPEFPGAVPFRVPSPGAARALLAALRPFAKAGDAHLYLVVEADPELEQALRAAGAEETMRTVSMDGPLPA